VLRISVVSIKTVVINCNLIKMAYVTFSKRRNVSEKLAVLHLSPTICTTHTDLHYILLIYDSDTVPLIIIRGCLKLEL